MKRSNRPVYLRRCLACGAGLLTIDRAYCAACPEIPMPPKMLPNALKTTRSDAVAAWATDIRALAVVVSDLATEHEQAFAAGDNGERLRAERKLSELCSAMRGAALDGLRRSSQADDSLASAELARRVRSVA